MPSRIFRWCWILLLLGFLPAQAEEQKVRYRLQVFHIRTNVYSKTTLSENIWASSKEAWEKAKKNVTLFDGGQFRLRRDRLEINEKGCFWNKTKLTFEEGYKQKLPTDKIKMIYSPNILKKNKEPARMKIEAKQPFQYFEKKENNLFELKEMHLPVGMDIQMRSEAKDKNTYLISDFKVTLRFVNQREQIRGVNLPVGKPILRIQEFPMKLQVKKHKNYGILIRPDDGDGVILIRLQLDDH
jgi:hypothetical protein